TLADAVLDRIVHNAHRLQLKGRQLAQATGAPDGRHLTANNRLWRDHIRPAGDRHPGRHQSERPADFDRNRWPTSIGMPGRHHRNAQTKPTSCILPIGRARTAMPKASDDHAPAPSAFLVYTPIVLERGPAQRLDVS